MSSSIDDSFYAGLGMLIGLIQSNHHLIATSDDDRASKAYNFYKDSNIPEIQHTTTLLSKLEAKVLIEQQQWPDHAVLNDIILIISRIRSLPSTSPIARFCTGFQILRQKVDEWNSVAHKLNHMRDLEIEIAEYVQRWTRLELQCWRECLAQTHEKVRSKAYRYWFFMFNLMHEYLNGTGPSMPCDMTDFKSVEKCFGNAEIDDSVDQAPRARLRTTEVISVVKQFIESSNFGEFSLRMDILKSFELYLQHTGVGVKSKRDALSAVLHNLHTYYTQFSAEIAENIKSKRTPIEKKLKEFVKIESYNKDLSYYSMKNNVARVHRHLHKFLRDFEEGLQEKIGAVFVWRANDTHALVDETTNSKKAQYEPNILDYILDVKVFMASQQLRDIYVTELPIADNSNLLARIDKLFKTSRNIVEQAVLHTNYPTLIYKLDVMVAGQIEHCDYLRKLEVDRSQEKPKQKSQAKHILQQKRKALADSFKQLTALGLSYRSGLLEGSLQKDLVDLKILPVNMHTLLDGSMTTHKTIHHKVSDPNVNLNVSYAKCIFKLKLLQTVMLQPNPELGMQNFERVKGFATDLFLLTQKQRQSLCKAASELQSLHKNIDYINQLLEIVSKENDDFRFVEATQRMTSIERTLHRIIEAVEQYDLLLGFVVAEEDKSYKTILSSNVSAFTQDSNKYKQFKASLATIAKSAKTLQKTMASRRDRMFHGSDDCAAITKAFDGIRTKVHESRNILKLGTDGSEFLILAKPLTDLLDVIESDVGKTQGIDELNHGIDDNHSYENIQNELENIVHQILLSMQNIYKKYAVKTEINYDAATGNVEETKTVESAPTTQIAQNGNAEDDKNDDDDDDDEEMEEDTLEENHLKQKIVEEIVADLKTVGLSTILKKLSKIVTVIRLNGSDSDKTALVKCIRQLVSITPILEQFNLLCQYYLVQQVDSHRVTVRMLGVMLTVFIELCAKGFCIPPDLMQDEDGEQNGDETDDKEGEGFGLEDGTGEKDVSDKIESEDQLDTAKKPGDEDDNKKEDADCKEEKGIDMSEDFDSKMQDVEKPSGDDSSDESEDEKDEELDKQMGETEDGADKLDDQIWGSEDEEEKDEEEEVNDEEENDGKGAKEDDDKHNDLGSNDQKETEGEEQDGLDAASDENKEKKQKEKDIDNINEQDNGEEQANPFHNELEEPPEPETMDLDNINLDNEEPANDNEEHNEENPFDIDTMKDQMADDGEENEDENGENDDNDKDENVSNKGDESNSDFDDDDEDDGKLKKDENDQGENEENEENAADAEKEEEPATQTPGLDEDEKNEGDGEDESKENEPKEDKRDFQESNDKESIEQNVQAMPDMQDKGSSDQVQNEQSAEEDQKQENQLDAQDTGEDKEGIGQADNEESEAGHQGVADTKNTKNTKQSKRNEKQEQRKPGETNEDRTVSQNRAEEKKQLKTIQEMNNSNADDKDDDEKDQNDTDEYQHVKEAKKTDKTTMDNGKCLIYTRLCFFI